MRYLYLPLFALIMFISPPLHAQPLDNLLAAAIQDYQFQDFDEAEKKFKSILKLAPDNLSAHYYLGVILTQKGKFSDAVEHLEHVANAPVAVEGIEAALIQAYQGANQFDKALPLNKKLHESDPENDAYAFQYAVNLQKTGSTGQAKEMYNRIISKGGSYAGPAHYQMGEMLYNEKSYVAAVEEFEAIDPNSPYRDAGQAYVKALKPLTRPLSVYLSTEYFYNDNVNAGGAARGITTTATAPFGSQGFTLIGAVNSRKFDIGNHFKAKLGYLYYGILHTQNNGAKENDFIGHFINPEISFHPNRSMDFSLKGDFQFFNYNHQKLGDNYGATFTATRYLESQQGSANLHAAYLNKNYTANYASGGTTQSLTYLDANTWSFGAGGSYSGKAWPANLTLDYTYNDEKTINNEITVIESNKALDSRFKEHAVRADVTLPFTGQLSRFALLANASYSKKNYSNIQTGALYADVINQKAYVNLTTLGIKAQARLWDEYGVTGSVGYEQTKSSSNTSSLSYKSNKYFGQLSAAY
ncbi:MAG: tetratricopeptide repeat protein [Mariprofundaceae bacterium]|nr:tetratricopeptide repeat protein [Mariprofundaceae bacterium]